MAKSITLVIPCYNEKNAVFEVLSEVRIVREIFLKQGFEKFEVIVVDDASTDFTQAEVKKFPFFQLIENKKNLGYGASLRIGFEKAQGELIAFMDMDESYSAQDLLPLCHRLKDPSLDMVFGVRAMNSEGMSLVRGLGNFIYTSLLRIFWQSCLKDVCTGLRVFRANRKTEILALSENGLNFSLELTLCALRKKWKISECDIEYRIRKGTSKLFVPLDGLQFLKTIFRP